MGLFHTNVLINTVASIVLIFISISFYVADVLSSNVPGTIKGWKTLIKYSRVLNLIIFFESNGTQLIANVILTYVNSVNSSYSNNNEVLSGLTLCITAMAFRIISYNQTITNNSILRNLLSYVGAVGTYISILRTYYNIGANTKTLTLSQTTIFIAIVSEPTLLLLQYVELNNIFEWARYVRINDYRIVNNEWHKEIFAKISTGKRSILTHLSCSKWLHRKGNQSGYNRIGTIGNVPANTIEITNYIILMLAVSVNIPNNINTSTIILNIIAILILLLYKITNSLFKRKYNPKLINPQRLYEEIFKVQKLLMYIRPNVTTCDDSLVKIIAECPIQDVKEIMLQHWKYMHGNKSNVPNNIKLIRDRNTEYDRTRMITASNQTHEDRENVMFDTLESISELRLKINADTEARIIYNVIWMIVIEAYGDMYNTNCRGDLALITRD